ncbi:MAG: hypothetical protein J7501_13295, partial [Bdellovibrio sp.]|nr:hypothetical protein [Bdellovibrio sp.]
GLLETSMNDLFDASTAQIAAMNNRVPEIVYFLIVLVTFFGISSMGFIEGAAQKRSTFGIITLSVLFAVVIVLIQDIDRPRRGLIRVGQEIYESTVQSAGENIAR